MNTQEREQLSQFLQQLTQAQAGTKDGEADALIRAACAQQPDASYLLVQRAIIQDHALQNAQERIATLQSELQQLRSASGARQSSSFLNDNAWGSSATTRASAAYAQPAARFAGVPAGAPAALAAAPSNAPSTWGSGMLGNIATTAAGVVAGSFLFQGIGHLLGNHTQAAGSMNGLSGNVAHDPQPAAALEYPADEQLSNAGVMDTSSLDDLIDDGTGDYV